jgi:hypothetical protein
MSLSGIAETVLSSVPLLNVRKGKLYHGNTRLKTCYDLLKLLPTELAQSVLSHSGMADPSSFFGDMLKAMCALSEEPQGAKPTKEGRGFVFHGADISANELRLYANVDDESRSIVTFEGRDEWLVQSSDDFTKRIKAALGDAAAEWHTTNHIDCKMEYLPNEPTIKNSELGLPIFNTWKPASWVPEGELPRHDSPPEMIVDYLHWLIPCKRELKHLLQWTRDCTFSRAGSVLILAGGQGVGKSFFAETILKNLVGEHNRKKAQTSWTRSNFQSSVKGCRLFIFEEKEINHEARELLKYYHDDKAVFDEKFQRVSGMPEKLHCSIVVCNNKLGSLKLSFADRKFFVPGLNKGNQKLDEAFGSDWVQRLKNLSDNSSEWNLQLASYLFYKFDDGASKVIPKTALFKEIAVRAMSRQARTFYDMCLRYPQFTAREFSKVNGRNIKLTIGDLESLLEDYYADFREPLAEVIPGSHLDKWEVRSLINKSTEASI